MSGNHVIRKVEEGEEEEDEKSMKVWDCGSPLYDAYELVAVSHLVERHIMILPYLSGSRNLARTDEYLSEAEKGAVETTENEGRASVLGFLWKRKRGDGEKKEKEKGKRQRVISGISKIFAWKK